MEQITGLFVCDDHGVPADDDGEKDAIKYAKDFAAGAVKINKALSWVGPANALIVEMYSVIEDQMRVWVTKGLNALVGVLGVFAAFGWLGIMCKAPSLLNLASFWGMLAMLVMVRVCRGMPSTTYWSRRTSRLVHILPYCRVRANPEQVLLIAVELSLSVMLADLCVYGPALGTIQATDVFSKVCARKGRGAVHTGAGTLEILITL